MLLHGRTRIRLTIRVVVHCARAESSDADHKQSFDDDAQGSVSSSATGRLGSGTRTSRMEHGSTTGGSGGGVGGSSGGDKAAAAAAHGSRASRMSHGESQRPLSALVLDQHHQSTCIHAVLRRTTVVQLCGSVCLHWRVTNMSLATCYCADEQPDS